MITFRQYLDEGINDKGIFKAVIVAGLPGAGKTYTISKISGSVSPKVVTADKATEFLSKKLDTPANNETWNSIFRDRTQQITLEELYQYTNGMLPLFVDSTSGSASAIFARSGVLESLGYDVGMVFVNSSPGVAKERAIARAMDTNRHVDVDFIDKMYKQSEDNKEFYSSKFEFFKEVNNDPGELNNEAIQKIFKSVAGFFSAPVKNPVGKRALAKLRDEKAKTLVPTLYEAEDLRNKIQPWYSRGR